MEPYFKYLIFFILLIAVVLLLKPDKKKSVSDHYKIQSLLEWKSYKKHIRHQIQDKIYGFLPQDLNTTFKIEKESALSSLPGTYKEVSISFEGLEKKILLSLFLPKEQKHPGVFMVLNMCGAHTLVDDDIVSVRAHAAHHKHCLKAQSRGSDKKRYAVKEILESGYAFATIDGAELAADGYAHKGLKKNETNSDLLSLIKTHSDKSKSWGAIAAWAYGYQLGARYLMSDPDINSKQIIASGHSRRGKAALLATALDENISMVVPHQSGTGGTASFWNSAFRESPKRMLSKSWVYTVIGEPGTLAHFFSEQFKNYIKEKKKTNKIDASHLIALIAPRPMLDTQGVKDFWAGGKSAWRMLKEADSVYSLYGVEGLKKRKWFGGKKSNFTAETTGNLNQHYLATGHTLNVDYWGISVDFADFHFKNN